MIWKFPDFVRFFSHRIESSSNHTTHKFFGPPRRCNQALIRGTGRLVLYAFGTSANDTRWLPLTERFLSARSTLMGRVGSNRTLHFSSFSLLLFPFFPYFLLFFFQGGAPGTSAFTKRRPRSRVRTDALQQCFIAKDKTFHTRSPAQELRHKLCSERSLNPTPE